MVEQTGCDHVMVGRGALGNPWIFNENIDGERTLPTTRDKVEMFIRHARLTAEHKGERMAVLEMRKHAGWYFKGIPGSARLRAQVNIIQDLKTLVREVGEFAADAYFS